MTPRCPSHKRLLTLGFTAGGVFGRGPLYHKVVGQYVWFIDRLDISGGCFDLTLSEMRLFKRGKLSLVPTGCCNPSGGPSKQGHIPAHIKDVLAAATLCLTSPPTLCIA